MQRHVVTDYVTSAARSTTGAGAALSNISNFSVAVFQVNITGAGTTLTVFVQTSYDGGANWVDIASSAQNSAATGIIILGHNSSGAAASTFVGTDGTMAASTTKTVGWGGSIRLKWVPSGSYTFSATASLQEA